MLMNRPAMKALFWVLCVGICLQVSRGRVLDSLEQSNEGNSLEIRTKRGQKCGRNYNLNRHSVATLTITLPTEEVNGTAFYEKNADCTWTIAAKKGNLVVLMSDYFSLEYSDDCVWDYLQIEEFDGEHRYCGWEPVFYVSKSDSVTIRFKSDETYEGFGFKITVKLLPDESSSASHCNSRITEGPPGVIYNDGNSGSDCFYRIQAPPGSLVELNTKKDVTFGNNGCEIESVNIYNIQGELYQLCSDAVQGVIPHRDEVLFIHYNNQAESEGERFELEYSFVDNFTPPPPVPTTPSPVGGDNDCSMLVKDKSDGFVYTAPEYQNNKNCIVVVRNTQLQYHVVQVQFTMFEMEESDNCTFDFLKVMSGEREDSPQLGGPFCGTSLKGRTFVSSGNSMRLEFKTDVSLAFYGFQAKISFVPSGSCDVCKGRHVCVARGHEKICLAGTRCGLKCLNGGTCVKSGLTSDTQCYCSRGFSGEDCSTVENQNFGSLTFKVAPRSRNLKRGTTHTEQCQVTSSSGDQGDITYEWTYNGNLIGEFDPTTQTGTHPGGVLQISDFSEKWEGQFSCFASTATSAAEHTFEYRLVEDCNLRIYPGPKPTTKKVGETATLMCYCPDALTIRWKKNGTPIDTVNDDRFNVLVNGYLEIKDVMLSDEAVYRCEAESDTGCYSYREAPLTVMDVKQHNDYCGLSIYGEEIRASSRISKGSIAKPKSSPWHVNIIANVDIGTNRKSFCGGSLISTKFVLTAAHCIVEFKDKFGKPWNQNNVKLILGSNDCLGKHGTERSPKRTIIHEDYEKLAYKDSDIALLELDSPVEYTDAIRPICIEPQVFVERTFFETGRFSAVSARAVGCGKLNRHQYPNDLQELFMPYVPRGTCKEPLDETDYKLTDAMICAGKKIARTGDTCGGDSGGSLVMDTDQRWVQTGIVSWGMGCDKAKFYGVYTHVGFFYDWIKEKTKFDEEEVPQFLNN